MLFSPRLSKKYNLVLLRLKLLSLRLANPTNQIGER